MPVEELVVADVDAAVHDPADRVARRPEGAADLEDVLSEIGEAASDARVRPALDSRLELVDLVVQGVEQAQVSLRDVVDEVVEDEPCRRRPVGVAGGLDLLDRERLLVRRGLSHRQRRPPA